MINCDDSMHCDHGRFNSSVIALHSRSYTTMQFVSWRCATSVLCDCVRMRVYVNQ